MRKLLTLIIVSLSLISVEVWAETGHTEFITIDGKSIKVSYNITAGGSFFKNKLKIVGKMNIPVELPGKGLNFVLCEFSVQAKNEVPFKTTCLFSEPYLVKIQGTVNHWADFCWGDNLSLDLSVETDEGFELALGKFQTDLNSGCPSSSSGF